MLLDYVSYQVYAVATTTLEPNKKIPKFNTEDKEWETLERGLFLYYVLKMKPKPVKE